jgi:hypothetical protein
MIPSPRALIASVLRKAAEGQPRRGPFHLPITGGWLSAEAWQYINGRNRLTVQFGRAFALRSTSDIVDQLQSQLAAERAQHAFNMSEFAATARRGPPRNRLARPRDCLRPAGRPFSNEALSLQ